MKTVMRRANTRLERERTSEETSTARNAKKILEWMEKPRA